jgi:cobalt-zinc-cadmium efflux system outer membrane protein
VTLLPQILRLKAEADADQMRSALIQARSELLLLLGWPESYATQSLYVEDAWPAATMTTSSGTRSPDAQIRSALENRPDLQAARIRVSQAEHNAELARRLIIPDITLVGYFLRDPGNFYTNTGGIGFNMELPLFNQFNGNIAKAGVELNQARLYIRQNEQAIHADVTRAEANWQSALSITQRFENSVLSRIEQLRQAEEYAYQRGRASLLQLIDAERNYKAMMMDYHVAQANRSNAWADLQAAVGASLEKITIDKEMGSDTRKIAERNHR